MGGGGGGLAEHYVLGPHLLEINGESVGLLKFLNVIIFMTICDAIMLKT